MHLRGCSRALGHLGDEVRDAVAGGFLADLRPAPGEALACEDTGLVGVRQTLVLAEQIADLASTDADVTCGNVGVLTDVAVQLGHERLTEAHDLLLGTTLGVEVRAALAAADGQARERVLEDLLEAEELHDAEVDARVEAQPTLVGAEHAVVLHTETAVDVHLAAVVDPRHAEDDLPLGLAETLDEPEIEVGRVTFQHYVQRLEHLGRSLMELGFARVAGLDLFIDLCDAVRGRHAHLPDCEKTVTPYLRREL